MRELERIVDKPEVVLSAPMLLIYAHKLCETVGKTMDSDWVPWVAELEGVHST